MKTIEFKLLLKPAQIQIFESWMRACCWIYNRALEMRIKAYKRRKESINYSVVILARGLVATRANRLSRDSTSVDSLAADLQVSPMKKEGISLFTAR